MTKSNRSELPVNGELKPGQNADEGTAQEEVAARTTDTLATSSDSFRRLFSAKTSEWEGLTGDAKTAQHEANLRVVREELLHRGLRPDDAQVTFLEGVKRKPSGRITDLVYEVKAVPVANATPEQVHAPVSEGNTEQADTVQSPGTPDQN
jgi:hypothetical protein